MRKQIGKPNFAEYAKLSKAELESRAATAQGELQKPGISKAKVVFWTSVLAIAVLFAACKQPDNTPENKPTPEPGKKGELLRGQNLVNGTLTAVLENITDGVGTPSVTINEAPGNTYVIQFGDVGKKIKLVATYSNGTITYEMPSEVPMPTLSVRLTGATAEGKVIAGDTTLTLTPTADKIVNPTFTYSWAADADAIANATGATLSPTIDQLGKTITGTTNLVGTTIKDDKTTAKVTNPEQAFAIGGVNFKFEYRKSDTASWAKLNPVIQNYITYITDPLNSGSVYEANITGLAGRAGAEFRIIVDYDTGKAAGFTATDGQTLRVGSEYLATATINRNTLRDAFGAMLAQPWPIVVGKLYSKDPLQGRTFVAAGEPPVKQPKVSHDNGWVRYTKAMQKRDGYMASQRAQKSLG